MAASHLALVCLMAALLPGSVRGAVQADAALDLHDIVGRHNTYRATHGSLPLTWNASIAAGAASWAGACIYKHSTGTGLGENLAAFTAGYLPADLYNVSAQMWYDENVQYNYAAPETVPFGNIGHFTAMVWRDTQQLGCARAYCPTGSPFPSYGADWWFVVCRYNPSGNWMAAPPDTYQFFKLNVKPPGTPMPGTPPPPPVTTPVANPPPPVTPRPPPPVVPRPPPPVVPRPPPPVTPRPPPPVVPRPPPPVTPRPPPPVVPRPPPPVVPRPPPPVTPVTAPTPVPNPIIRTPTPAPTPAPLPAPTPAPATRTPPPPPLKRAPPPPPALGLRTPTPVGAPLPAPVASPPPPAVPVLSPAPVLSLTPATPPPPPTCALDTASGIVVEVRYLGAGCSDALMEATAQAVAQVSGTVEYCHVTKCRVSFGRMAVRTKLNVDIAPTTARRTFVTAFKSQQYTDVFQGLMGASAGAYTVQTSSACYFPGIYNCVY